jgi:hypothetical protein
MVMAESQPNFSLPTLGRVLLACAARVGLMIILAGAILLAAWWTYQLARSNVSLRVNCLVAEIVAGIGSTLCLAGAMQYLDVPMIDRQPPWYVRWVLKSGKRVLLTAELATTALALAAAGILIFDFKIPGTAP